MPRPCRFAFFALQIVILGAERRLGLRGVAWVWLALGCAAPIFVEPFLRCFEEGDNDAAPSLTQTLLFFYGGGPAGRGDAAVGG